jgi:hypothetical protein
MDKVTIKYKVTIKTLGPGEQVEYFRRKPVVLRDNERGVYRITDDSHNMYALLTEVVMPIGLFVSATIDRG